MRKTHKDTVVDAIYAMLSIAVLAAALEFGIEFTDFSIEGYAIVLLSLLGGLGIYAILGLIKHVLTFMLKRWR